MGHAGPSLPAPGPLTHVGTLPALGTPLCPADLSASSNTTYSTVCSFSFISTATCTRRPGVAMILWEQR